MALSFALSLSFAVLLSAVLPVQSSYCASTCAVHVTQPILFFVANAPNHIPGLSRKPMVDPHRSESESESEMFLFDPYQKYIQSNNETILDQGTPIKTSLVANIRAAYYIINNYFFISQAKNT